MAKNAISPEAETPQDVLFTYVRGAYNESPRPWNKPAPIANTVIFAPPEVKKISDVTADEMISVALEDRVKPDVYGLYNQKRTEFSRKYHWTPFSDGEVTAALATLPKYLLGAKDKGGLSAVRNVLNTVDRYRSQSVIAIETLREAQNVETGEAIPRAVKENLAVRQVLAQAIFARNSLNLYEWPRHYDKRKKETKENKKITGALLAITNKLQFLDDDTLKSLAERTRIHHQARLSFWTEQVELAKTDRETEDLVSAGRSNV
jgi:hypothetical protein